MTGYFINHLTPFSFRKRQKLRHELFFVSEFTTKELNATNDGEKIDAAACSAGTESALGHSPHTGALSCVDLSVYTIRNTYGKFS